MIGTLVGGYRIEEKLGEGGMGTVYRATEVNLDRAVAIKVLNPQLARKPEIVDRFRAEAKAQANLNHPNVATLYAFVSEPGNAMIVMEFVDGENFQQILKRRGALPSAEVVPLFRQALAGVGAAHEMGIAHRDLKPANIMLNQRGLVKVMDFGIAKVAGEQGLTRTGVQLGTVFYMSPEQVKGGNTDARSDIYSLGVTLYELLTGRVPFDGASEYIVLADHVNTSPPLPSAHAPGIPRGVENIVLKAMEKRPEDRFQSVAQFAEALEHPEAWEGYVFAGMGPTAEIQSGPWRSDAVTKTMIYPGFEAQPPPPKGFFWTPMRAGLVAFCAVAVLGMVAGLRLNRPKPAVPRPPRSIAAEAHPDVEEPPSASPVVPVPPAENVLAPKPASPQLQHVTLPAKTPVHVHLKDAIAGAPAREGQVFTVLLNEPLSVGGAIVVPAGEEAHIVLVKSTGSAKAPKLRFQLSSIQVDGKPYKVRSDTLEFSGAGPGKRVGKLQGIGNAVGSLVGVGKHADASVELPADLEMTFLLKAAVPVALR
jgi:serine/threonine-protein kinase